MAVRTVLIQILKVIDELKENAIPEEGLSPDFIKRAGNEVPVHKNRRPPFCQRQHQQLRFPALIGSGVEG